MHEWYSPNVEFISCFVLQPGLDLQRHIEVRTEGGDIEEAETEDAAARGGVLP